MKCRKCGTEFTEGIFCPECGTKNEKTVEEPSKVTKDKSEKKPKRKIGKIILGAIVAYLGIALVMVTLEGGIDDSETYKETYLKNSITEATETASSKVNTISITEIDMVDYIVRPSIELVEVCPEFDIRYDELDNTYMDHSEDNMFEVENDKITSVMLLGKPNESPSFAGVKVGDNISDITISKLSSIGYQKIDMGVLESQMLIFGDLETKDAVVYSIETNGNITGIIWMKKYLEILELSTESTDHVKAEVLDLDYGFIYGGIADMYYNEYSVYALHDMNNDGYQEFFMQTGERAADTRYVVYTTDGNRAIQLGEIWGNVSLYAHESGNGIYTDYGQMGYEEVKYVYVENGTLAEEVVFAGQVEEYGYVNNKRMKELDISISTYEMTEGPMMGDSQPTDNVSSEFIFPESGNRYLTEDEVRMLSKEMLKFARNEIFARHGYIFKSEDLQRYFESTSWYYGTVLGSDFDMEAVFNEYEKKNVELIKQIENE